MKLTPNLVFRKYVGPSTHWSPFIKLDRPGSQQTYMCFLQWSRLTHTTTLLQLSTMSFVFHISTPINILRTLYFTTTLNNRYLYHTILRTPRIVSIILSPTKPLLKYNFHHTLLFRLYSFSFFLVLLSLTIPLVTVKN